MQLVHTNNTFSFILQEDEWYSATGQQREAWTNQIMREGKEAEARFLNILVQPDELMSISPVPRKHSVWRHDLGKTDRETFRDALLNAYAKSDLPEKEKIAIARRVFGV